MMLRLQRQAYLVSAPASSAKMEAETPYKAASKRGLKDLERGGTPAKFGGDMSPQAGEEEAFEGALIMSK